MRTKVLMMVWAFASVSCSSPDELEIPPSPDPPSHWNDFSTSTMSNSDCPTIAGIYLEPPFIYRLGVDTELIPKDITGLYSRYIPFHRAERNELEANEMSLLNNSFAIRQTDSTQFFFSYFNEPTNVVVEYHFQSDKGDFECRNGRIEFPIITSYGVIEGMSVNFQIKNVLLKDVDGALVIHSTGGPYRGRASKQRNAFMTEFIRYLPEGAKVLNAQELE